jgi:hypothetical protein
VVFCGSKNNDIWDKGADHEAPIDHHVCEHDEPAVSGTTLKLSRRFTTCHRTRRVFPSNTNSNEKAVCGQSCKHALKTAMVPVRTSCKGGEDNQDHGGEEKGIFARPFVTEVTKQKLSKDSSGKGDGRDVLLGAGLCIIGFIKEAENGGNRPNDLNRR